jgi:hypothetical protein
MELSWALRNQTRQGLGDIADQNDASGLLEHGAAAA